MALVTVSGFPSAGKTRRAHELKAFFDAKLAAGEGAPISEVTIVDDESVHVTRAAYDGECPGATSGCVGPRGRGLGAPASTR